MSQPEFTDEERYLIHDYKSRLHSSIVSDALWFDLSYVIPVAMFALLGLVYGNVWLIAAGFAVMIGFKLREIFVMAKWTRTFAGIVHKYESALAETDV